MRTGVVITRSRPCSLEFAQIRERADRIPAIPILGRRTDQVEHPALGSGDLGQFYHRSRMILGIEIDEAATCADFAAHYGLESLGFEPRQIGVVILGPVGNMLQAGI